MPASVYLKEPAATRFVAGGLVEVESLLGSPLPLLPVPEREGEGRVYYVRFQPLLRTLLVKCLQGLLAQVGAETPGLSARADVRARDQEEYEAALGRALRAIHATDRRLGLVNLFWLAHSLEVAGCLHELEGRAPAVRRAKYSLHPLLSSLYRRLDQGVRRELARGNDEAAARARGGENLALLEAVFDDGFALTETTLAELDLTQFLSFNKRYRLSAEVFQELQGVLVREAERRLRENERGLVSRINRHLQGVSREQLATPEGLMRLAFCGPVMSYLLADPWNTGAKLMAGPRVRAEAERRPAAELLDGFLDFVAGLKRFEVISHVRERVTLAREGELEAQQIKGLRFYDFGESAQVMNNAVNATVLFLDLRGFTKTSEGQISERDLTRELYTVFDVFLPHLRRFGGTVDKVLGDGMMVTFGTEYADPQGALNAVRAAILCQDSLHRLREEGRTYFKMGISIHYGRVYLARFLVDEESVQCTVIGRNVNLAGRLSSAAKKPLEEDEITDPSVSPPQRALGLSVTVDPQGTLFNEGIAISRATFVQLESLVALEDMQEGATRRIEYYDDVIKRRVLMRYAGDAKFKGVRAAFPVFEVDYTS